MCTDNKKKERLLKTIQILPENDVIGIEFIETKLGDVIFAIKERYGKTSELVDARKLSDGTLRCIAALAAVLTSRTGSLIIIEEIDNGIHPARVYQLVEELGMIAKEQQSDIIMTTHNDALMNQYKKEYLEGVSIVFRDKDRGRVI